MKHELVVEMAQLSKSYQAMVALQPTNLAIPRGEIFGLVGRNGAGKSTLLKLLTGQVSPSSGTLALFGVTGPGIQQQRQRTGALVEQPAFFPKLSGRQNLEYYRRQQGIPDPARVSVLLADLKLTEIADKPFKSYSLGNKQRLGLALALLNRPDLLILDEPINGLDPLGMIEFRELLLRLNREQNMTIIISSHLLAELEMLVTSVGFIEKGEILAVKTSAEIKQESQDYIELEVDQQAKAIAVLEQELGLTNYKVFGTGGCHLYGVGDELGEISQVLNRHGIQVFKMTSHQASLEEYFTHLLGGKAHV